MVNKSTQEPGPKPTYLVVETNLHYQSKKQGELVLDLDFPFGILIDATQQSGDDRKVFITILEALGDQATLEKVRLLGAVEGMELIQRFFAEFEKLIGSSAGE